MDAMCYSNDARPPLPPIKGGSTDEDDLILTSADGTRFGAYAARARMPSGAGVMDRIAVGKQASRNSRRLPGGTGRKPVPCVPAARKVAQPCSKGAIVSPEPCSCSQYSSAGSL